MGTSRYVRPMGIGETFRTVFELYRRHFLKLVLINAVAVVPYLFGDVVNSSLPSSGARSSSVLLSCLWPLINLVLVLICTYISLAATTVAASNAILARPVSVRGAYGRVLSPKLIGRFLLCGTEVGIRVELGLILLIIPGLIFYAWYMFWAPVFVIEKITARPRLLKRSRELANGQVGRLLFAYFILYFVPYLVLSYLAGYAIGRLVVVPLVLDVGLAYRSALLIGQLLLYALVLVAAPVGSLLVTQLYYSQRAQKENYNEDLLAQDLEYTPMGEMVTV